MTAIALIPARGGSVRVPGKNTRPFFGEMSLLQMKVLALRRCSLIERIVVSSESPLALEQAAALGAEPRQRDPSLCSDHVDLGELFAAVLKEFGRDIVYWAHPTSPFVKPQTIDKAVGWVLRDRGRCVIGVQRRQDFLWSSPKSPHYHPTRQPRSQDLPCQWRVTGGIHVAKGSNFVQHGSLAFDPLRFFELSYPEALDIDTEDEWRFCERIAPVIAMDIIGGAR